MYNGVVYCELHAAHLTGVYYSGLFYSQKLDQLSTPIDTLDLKNCRLDNRSCEALEAVLSRMQMTTLDLERTGLEDDVSHKLECPFLHNPIPVYHNIN